VILLSIGSFGSKEPIWLRRRIGRDMATAQNEAKSNETEALTSWVLAIAETQDREAFAKLFGLLAPKVKGYCMKRGASAAEAEETVQETMIQVWRRAKQFDPKRAKVTTWVFTIARNKRIDQFRKEQHPEITEDDVIQNMSETVDAHTRIENLESGATLSDRMKELPEDQTQVIHKAFFEDKTHQVIAEELGMPLGTVKSRIRLALSKLKSSMSEFET
jgi:RNA polymerase sigma-70 factor (ECF subfamily)